LKRHQELLKDEVIIHHYRDSYDAIKVAAEERLEAAEARAKAQQHQDVSLEMRNAQENTEKGMEMKLIPLLKLWLSSLTIQPMRSQK
jgi:hypothetical protein